jgi:hypothetical protein
LFIARIFDLTEQVRLGDDPEHKLERINNRDGTEPMRHKQIHYAAIRRVG